MTNTEGHTSHDECHMCEAPGDKVEPQYADNGQYKWSTCQQCGAKHLPNGLVEL